MSNHADSVYTPGEESGKSKINESNLKKEEMVEESQEDIYEISKGEERSLI